jgi:hypothetical protein
MNNHVGSKRVTGPIPSRSLRKGGNQGPDISHAPHILKQAPFAMRPRKN